MTRDDFNRYVADLQRRWPLGLFLRRSFRTAEEWNRWSSLEFRARAARDNEPQLENVLHHRRAVVLGEAGSGKSSIARKAIELAAQRGFIPIFIPLNGYAGNLRALIDEHVGAAVLREADIEGTDAPRLYIFDGFDEVAADRFDDFVGEFNELSRGEPNSRILLTSRQAFFIHRQAELPQPLQVFYILDFSDDDVDAVIDQAGVDRAAFRDAANRSHLSQELGNPLALDALLRLFRDCGSLGQTRSDALQHVVDSALTSRPTSNLRWQKRALRMLAVAMEIAARNELTDNEAEAVLRRALRIDAAAAQILLDELTQSLLLRTPNGYSFQLRSYGEYLAAEELGEIQETDRILRLTYLDNTFRPSDSWRNCMSYIMERHGGIRRAFSRRFPDWTLTASPSVFSEQDRTTIVNELLASLINDNTYLLHHPTIRVGNLARFVPEAMFPRLRGAVESANDVEAGNAALLLAACRDRTMANRLLDLALDRTRTAHVRSSALGAYDQIGTCDAPARLLDIQDWDEPTALARVDAAAGLMDASNAALVLAALSRTDAMVSSAFYRFYELNDPADLEAVLDALISLPGDAFRNNRLSYYLDRFWWSIARNWRPGWAAKVAEVVLRFEEAGNPDDGDLRRDFVAAMQSLPDRGHAIGRHIIERLLGAGRDIQCLFHSIPSLVGPDDARWLRQQGGSNRLAGTVRAFGPAETQAVLQTPITPEQQEQIDRWRREEEQRQERLQRFEQTISSSEDAEALYRALVQVDDPTRWPDVSTARRGWLANFVGTELNQLDLRTRIRWRSETELTQPRILPLLLGLIKRYELRLANDEPLAWTLLSETHTTRAYHQQFGLSDGAVEVIEHMLEDATTSNPGLDQILSFVRESRLTTPRIRAALERIASDVARPNRIREGTVQVIAEARDSDALLRVVPTLPIELRREGEDKLVEAQHRGTIERRLQHLLNDAAALAAGEVDVHFNNPLNWVGKIREPAVWDTLVRLRRLALQSGLDQVASIFTKTLSEIDMLRAAHVVESQIDDTPEAWRPYLRRHAVEMERDATIRAAQGVAFEGVLRRLEGAAFNRFKIWTEGPTDCPSVEELARHVPGAENLNIVSQAVGGWNMVLNQHWTPQNLGDGCQGFVMLLDADRAYDSTKSGRVLRADVRAVLAKFAAAGIEYHILDRYGLENYFAQHAFETVLGSPLGLHFPLDPMRPVQQQIPGYKKNMNPQLARLTAHADLAGSDLGNLLDKVARLASI